ncbi:MAG TPA: L,D-transpeptidase family protein [Vicinamibacterales bacterium]|nr:L,D-transpeptidase family protein [Vicinamibacterales bacterium]
MHRTHIIPILAIALTGLTASASRCSKTPAPDPVLTSLTEVLAAKPVQPVKDDIWDDVHEFYRLRGGKPAWVTDKPTSKATEAIHVLQSAREHGLATADYLEPKIEQLRQSLESSKDDAPNRAQQLAELDARITTSLLTLGHDVALGRTKPTQGHWKAKRLAPDLAGTLNRAASEDIDAWLKTVQPVHPEYEALRVALIGLYGQQEAGATAPAPADAEAIKVFQEHHAIPPTGKLDAATKAAMKVPLEERIQQVRINLERWRWMPDDLGARHFLVNIPYFHLIARENGKAVKDIRVVVGKPTNKTPIFSGNMETVVFSPYWNIPDSIVEGETAPAMARDPRYLARNNMEILRVSGKGSTQVNPADVNWDDPQELKQLAFRQRPGPNNALGHVKFLFPNEYNVYLHDTPADNLFARPGRAFSHGCVRVEEPEALAQYVLRDDPTWTEAKILTAMHSGDEQHVKLKAEIPVHIVYFTAWVDDKGGLHFQPDIYGYDRIE